MKTNLRSIIPACLIGLAVLGPAVLFALTPEQVIALKKAGVSDETIQQMIRQEENAGKAPEETLGRKEIKDGRGDTVIIYSTGTGRTSNSEKADEEKKKIDNSWKMLEKMVIDGRTK